MFHVLTTVNPLLSTPWLYFLSLITLLLAFLNSPHTHLHTYRRTLLISLRKLKQSKDNFPKLSFVPTYQHLYPCMLPCHQFIDEVSMLLSKVRPFPWVLDSIPFLLPKDISSAILSPWLSHLSSGCFPVIFYKDTPKS